ncbi:hypothetical protein BH18ACT12_BH18ACT12_01850 [soil metagenome]
MWGHALHGYSAVIPNDRVASLRGDAGVSYNPLVPRSTKRWRELYRVRAAVERELERLKHQFGLAALRVRGLERVQLHADLVMLGPVVAGAQSSAAVPLAAWAAHVANTGRLVVE